MKKLLILIFLILSNTGFSQDTQYWSQQYGTKSFYLGGVVIGSMLDLSATYYNPGAIALMKNPEFLTGAKSFSLTQFRFKDGAGKEHDFEALRGDAPPDLFAGLFSFGKKPQDRLVYSFLIRKRIKFRVYSSADDLRNIENAGLGNDKYFGITQIEWDVNETWLGLTYSKLLSKNIGLGLTQYFSYFGLYTKVDINSQALTENRSMPITHLGNFINSYNIKTLSKIGLFFDYNPLKFGFTTTLPSINLFGTGDYYSNETYAGQDLSDTGDKENYMDNYFIEDAKSYYPSSWTIGAGFSYAFKKSQIHFSMEWFAPVKPFNHLDLPNIVNKTTGETDQVSLMQEYKSVTNFGIGWEHIFNDHFSLFGGATTNFTATPPGSKESISLSSWDIYQISAGTVFSYKWIKMNTGIKFAFGSQNAKQLVNYPTASLDNFLIGNLSIAKINYKELKVIIGFSLRLFSEEKNSKIKKDE
jgi:hypothetical protein